MPSFKNHMYDPNDAMGVTKLVHGLLKRYQNREDIFTDYVKSLLTGYLALLESNPSDTSIPILFEFIAGRYDFCQNHLTSPL